MIHFIISYLILHWLLVISAIAGAIGFNIWNQQSSMPLAKMLLGFLAIAVVFHVIEEWVWPAGLHYIHNMRYDSPAPDRFPMNQFSDMLTNFGAIVLAAYGMWKHSDKMFVQLGSFLFCILEVFMHTQLGFMGMELFGDVGLSVPYSPGSATSFLFFLPIGVGNAIVLAHNKAYTIRNFALGVGLLVAVLVTLIAIPEFGLQDINTPYGFPNNGFYDQYLFHKQ